MEFALILNAPELKVDVKENLIVCADGGYRHAKDKSVYAVIGDFDTLGYLPKEVKTVVHPVDKDKTDGELALDFIKGEGGKFVSIYGGSGGKFEHVLGNVNLLAYADSIGLNAKMVEAREEMFFVRDTLFFNARVGDNLSIIPFGGEVTFESSLGLKYPLHGLKILPYSSLGISNEITEGKVEIKVKNGSSFVIISKKS